MKDLQLKPLLLLFLAALFFAASPALAQQKEKSRFENVDLIKLKKALQKGLVKDGLITSKQDEFYLKVGEEKLQLDGTELTEDFASKYRKLLASFNVQAGPDRKVYVGPKGVAVGDFRNNGFYGVAKGTFKDNVLGSK